MTQNKTPEKYSPEWYAIHGEAEGTPNPLLAKTKGWPIRLSKSAFMTYLGCPRKYWWTRVADLYGPSTHHMVHGTAVHTALENVYGNWNPESNMAAIAEVNWEDGEPHEPHAKWDENQQDRYTGAVDALIQLEQGRLQRWGEEHFTPVEFEQKHVLRHEHESHVFNLVGMIDGVLRHPDGGLVIAELKTGKATKNKLSKTRKELCFYRHMLAELWGEEAVYFYYLFPECENYDLYVELDGKKNTEVWLGDLQGMAVLEKVSTRSVNAMHKSLDAAMSGILNDMWGMKWNDYFCTQWCDFNMACESEMLGVEPDPTVSYTGVQEGWA